MANKPLPSPEVLRQLLKYEPKTGKLFWRDRDQSWFTTEQRWVDWMIRFSGKETFTTINRGYLTGTICHRVLKAHRVIMAMENNSWPPHQVDHINRNKSDNRLINLRLATSKQNMSNRGCMLRLSALQALAASKGGSSHYLGVMKTKFGTWDAKIQTKGVRLHLGAFKDEIEAARAYDAKSREIRGRDTQAVNFPV